MFLLFYASLYHCEHKMLRHTFQAQVHWLTLIPQSLLDFSAHAYLSPAEDLHGCELAALLETLNLLRHSK